MDTANELIPELPKQPASFFCYIRRLMSKQIGKVPEDTKTYTNMTCLEAGCTKDIRSRCAKITMLESNSMKNAGTETKEGFYNTAWNNINI